MAAIACGLPKADITDRTPGGVSHSPKRTAEEWTGLETSAQGGTLRNPCAAAADLRRMGIDGDIDRDAFRWPRGHFNALARRKTEAVPAHCTDDLAWFANAAGGLADVIDAPGARITATTLALTHVEGGRPDDGEHRYLA